LIVDHALRPESSSEAALVKTRLEQSGIETEILRWQHEVITARMHEQAREARYTLLIEACRRHGACDLFVAHHRDDQAETILMRLAKGSGVDGLAGIAAQSHRDGIRLLRPFLSVSKQRLIATCEAENLVFVSDPSNRSEKFTRGRLRKILPLLADEGMTIDSLLSLGTRAAEAKEAIHYYAKEFLASAVICDVGGSLRLNRVRWREVPRAIALQALSQCLRNVHDDGHPPEYAGLSSLLDALLSRSVETARTFYGCIASLSADKALLLREPSAASEILPLHSGKTVLWDKRWLVTANTEIEAGQIGALGLPPHAVIDELAPRLRHLIPQGRIRASLPALWRKGALCAIPSFDENAAFRLKLRRPHFP
jgi:tRNA(Ile)-lysidine synthase